MIEDQNKKEFETEAVSQTPGEMLRHAREARKMSHIDVAKQLKLKVQWVVDIENDHYQNTLALIYVRGHLRSYARLLELPVDEVMEAFDRLKIEEPRTEKLPPQMEAQFIKHQSMLPRPRKAWKKIVTWIAVIAAIVIIILVAMWWRGQRLISDDSGQTQANLHTNHVVVGMPAFFNGDKAKPANQNDAQK